MAKKVQGPKGGNEPVIMAATVNRKVQSLGADPSKGKSLDTIGIDVADVYDVCANYQRLVDTFLSLPDDTDPEIVMRIIFDIESHLGAHLSYHYRRLLKGLRALEKVVQPDKKKREEFASKVFEELSKRVRDRDYGSSLNLGKTSGRKKAKG
ncbi:MAG TPA: hypothetical protein VEZ90_07800 [Blastocatellia bacterium]|nr:hypothetical protein [Blastocatellia bacterium]